MKHPQKNLPEFSPPSIRAMEPAIQVLDSFPFRKKKYTMEKLARSTNLSKSTVFRNYVRKGVAAGGTAFPVFSAKDRRTKEAIRLVAKRVKKIREALGFTQFS